MTLPWSVASPASINGTSGWGYFSATCWYYGRNLYDLFESNSKANPNFHQKGVNVIEKSWSGAPPIGLVASSYGGTIIEAWSSPRVLHACNYEVFPVASVLF